jgi:predicted SnoaL-like aldol condensation-catalyzing enzyme
MTTNKDLVVEATTKLFGDRDLSVLDTHWSTNYIQHSTAAGPGVDGLRTLASSLPDGFRYEVVRVVGEGDLVVTHGLYHGFGPDPTVAFDLWRIEDGRIAEHWDAMQPFVAVTASGRSMTDGPTEVTEPDKTAANKELVGRFVDAILVHGDLRQLTGFFDGDAYAQHHPLIPDNVSGLTAAFEGLAEQGVTMCYEHVHRTVADGEFVFVQSEGIFGGAKTAFYDLFRVANGNLAEHWDVVFTIPETLPHDNGVF